MNQKLENKLEVFNSYMLGIVIAEIGLLLIMLLFIIIVLLSEMFGATAVGILFLIVFIGIMLGNIINN